MNVVPAQYLYGLALSQHEKRCSGAKVRFSDNSSSHSRKDYGCIFHFIIEPALGHRLKGQTYIRRHITRRLLFAYIWFYSYFNECKKTAHSLLFGHAKIVIEYDKKIPKSQTADKSVTP